MAAVEQQQQEQSATKRARLDDALPSTTTTGNIIVQFEDLEGRRTGPQLDLPQSATPEQLQTLLRGLLKEARRQQRRDAADADADDNDDDTTPYAFLLDGAPDREFAQGELGALVAAAGASVERALRLVYVPQAAFRVRPVARCTASIPGHTEAVLAVSFSPDGSQLASGSGDTTVRLWDLSTQSPKATLRGHKAWVLVVGWSPDGRLLATGDMDGSVWLWDPHGSKEEEEREESEAEKKAGGSAAKKSGSGGGGAPAPSPPSSPGPRALGSCQGHRKWVTSVAWEPLHRASPSTRFATASRDHTARVWDARTRRCLLTLAGHSNVVTCVRWGGEGLLFTASRDSTINVWDDKNGTLVRTLKGHGHWVNHLALSTEAALRTGCFDHTGKVAVEAGDEDEAAADEAGASDGGDGGGNAKASKEASRQKQCALEKRVAQRRYDAALAQGARVASAAGAAAAAAGGAPAPAPSTTACERLVSASDDFTLFLWEPSRAKSPLARLSGHVQPINHVAFSPDGGRWLLSASFDKAVKLWDGCNGKFVATLRGHVGPVYQVAWAPDSRLFVSGSKDSTLKVWEVRTRKLKVDLPGHADEVFAVDWAPGAGGGVGFGGVASGGKDRVLKLWRH
jgi:ribosome assembly protein 4